MDLIPIFQPKNQRIQFLSYAEVLIKRSLGIDCSVACLCSQPNRSRSNLRTMEKDWCCYEEELPDSFLRLSLPRFCDRGSSKRCLANQTLHLIRVPDDCGSVICQEHWSLRLKNRGSSYCRRH